MNELWDEPFTIRLEPEQVKYGEKNLLAVRVHASQNNGGIWKPVKGYSPEGA